MRVEGSGLRAQVRGWRVEGSGLRVEGVSCTTEVSGFMVSLFTSLNQERDPVASSVRVQDCERGVRRVSYSRTVSGFPVLVEGERCVVSSLCLFKRL